MSHSDYDARATDGKTTIGITVDSGYNPPAQGAVGTAVIGLIDRAWAERATAGRAGSFTAAYEGYNLTLEISGPVTQEQLVQLALAFLAEYKQLIPPVLRGFALDMTVTVAKDGAVLFDGFIIDIGVDFLHISAVLGTCCLILRPSDLVAGGGTYEVSAK